MNNQYDYDSRLEELTKGIDTTFKEVLEPFIYGNISDYIKKRGINIDILDVGCGCGYLTESIAKKNAEAKVEGIDISESAIVCAKSHFNLKFTQQDVVAFDESTKFDVVVYNMVLHNLLKLEQTIRKTSIILKHKGIVLITIPHPTFWLSDKVARGKITLAEPFNYNLERLYKIPFQIKNGLQHQTELTYYHRRLTTYINTFSKHLKLVRFEEVDFKNGYPTMLRVVLEKLKSDPK